MANKFRGEVPVTIAGKTYPCALTLDALARLGTALDVETISDIEQRLIALRVSDMVPILVAVLEGNEHSVPDDLSRMHWRQYVAAMVALHSARPEPVDAEAVAPPRKRASS